ncbi:hypothetical protein HJG60_009092 [Phyllostomus discolor]|uniref:Uncharacterized protein n=1 Tax=Phyllostomus discolor TaxID=89673 RepID=A0A833YFC2_9CHIR|nr:hypothetical protein HJG60_009092 [Phyllostomus discolor]
MSGPGPVVGTSLIFWEKQSGSLGTQLPGLEDWGRAGAIDLQLPLARLHALIDPLLVGTSGRGSFASILVLGSSGEAAIGEPPPTPHPRPRIHLGLDSPCLPGTLPTEEPGVIGLCMGGEVRRACLSPVSPRSQRRQFLWARSHLSQGAWPSSLAPDWLDLRSLRFFPPQLGGTLPGNPALPLNSATACHSVHGEKQEAVNLSRGVLKGTNKVF